ncbi:MAG: hypothetical protein ACHQVS_02715 [Candidatus Babeliales bacterium]
MKKQLLVLGAFICSTMSVQGISIKRHITEAIEQAIVQEVVEKNQAQPTTAPVLRTEVSEAVKERQKQVQSLAKFIASKKTIRTVSKAFKRSIKPTEKLLHRCFHLCDFYRHQLRFMDQSLQEFIDLFKKHEATLVESLFSMMSDPRFAALMQTMSELDATNPQQIKIDQEQLKPLLEEFGAKLESMEQDFAAWTKKWEPEFDKLRPYITARTEYHKEHLQEAMNAFGKSMIWQHWAAALGLTIRSYWHARGVKIQESSPQLLSATYTHAMQNQEALKQEMHDAFATIVTAYEDMFRRIFSHAYSRSPR